MPTAIADLITIDDISSFKAPVGGLGSDEQTALTSFIPFAIAYIQDRLGHTIKETAYSQFVNTQSSQLVVLPSYPVNPATITLTVQGSAWTLLSTASIITATGHAWLDSEWGMVHVTDALFPKGYGKIFVAMTAGWGGTYPYPVDLKLAAVILTMLFEQERQRVGVKAKTVGPESISEYIRNSSDYKTAVESAIMRHTRII